MSAARHDGPKRLLLGVSICIFRADEVLLIERGKAPGIGRWAPVGGGIEPGETAEAAALREVEIGRAHV
jgi:8-oxo-dGTP diphosphatase